LIFSAAFLLEIQRGKIKTSARFYFVDLGQVAVRLLSVLLFT